MPDDDFFIRRFARERDRDDMPVALELWEEACVRKFDFVEGMIRGFRFPGGQPLPPADREDAQTECMTRILDMGHNFRGRSGAEFRAAIKRAVWYGCMDVGREVLSYEEHIGGSLDERFEDGDGGVFDAVVERYLAERQELAADVAEGAEEMAHFAELFDWAIDQVENDNHRVVLELSFRERLNGEEIADRLGISIDNVYQRRSRGVTKVKEILRDHRP